MSDSSTPPPGRSGPVFPPEYPYGTPAAGDESLLREPGHQDGRADPGPAGPGPAGPGPAGWAGPDWTTPAPPNWTAPAPPGLTRFPPETAAVRAQATAALIVAALLVIPCLDVLVIPAIVTAAIAGSRARTDVPLARVLIRVSWVWIAVSVALEVAFIGWAVVTPQAPAGQ